MPDIDNIAMTIEELGMDGSVSLSPCSRSTVYRYKNEINRRLAAQKFDWRVTADVQGRALYAVPAQQMTGK